MKIDFAILNSMYRLRMPISTAYSMCEANKSTAQPKDDTLTEHYEFNWCLQSPLGGRLFMQSVSQDNHDVPRTRCEEQPTGNSPSQFLPAEFGVCFGKAAIIRPGAPPHECLLPNFVGVRHGSCVMRQVLAIIYDKNPPPH